MNPPDIETSRLRFRRFTPDDLDALFELFSDREVVKYLGDGKPATKEETVQHLRNFIERYWEQQHFGRWALIHKADGRLIGYCGLRLLNDAIPELGYVLARAYWGNGLATEAAHACLRYGFEQLRLERIVAATRPENVASQHILKKLGMKYEGDENFYGINCVYYSIARENYRRDDSYFLLHDRPHSLT